jgi:hypothetical protein
LVIGKRKRGKGKGEAESGGVFAKSGGDFTDGETPSDRQLFKTREGVSPSHPQLFKRREKVICN